MTITARTVPLAEITPTDRARWERLSTSALEPNPFLDPAYLLTAHTWMAKAQDIRLVVVEDQASMLALLPISTLPRTRRLPLSRASTAGPFLRSFAAYLAPLVDRDRAEEAVDGLLAHLGRRSAGVPPLLELTLFPGSGPLHESLHDSARRLRVPVVERYRFERAVAHLGSDTDWRARLSSSRRKSLTRYARRTVRELGELELADCGGDPAALAELVALESAGWKGERGRGYALALSPAKLAWHETLCAEFRRRGQLHLLRLRAGGRTIFMSLSFQVGNRVFSTIDAYDEGVAHLSPGSIGRAAELDHFQSGPEPLTLDPCMHPKHHLSSGLYPDRDALTGLLLAPRGLHARAALRAVPALRGVRAALSRPERHGTKPRGVRE